MFSTSNLCLLCLECLQSQETIFSFEVDLSLVDGEKDSVYFCGNSLGLQPKEAQTLVMQEMEKWQQMYEC